MSEMPIRPCPACSNNDGKSCGLKNNFDILICGRCRSLYTSALPLAGETEDYDEYYTESNLNVPTFVAERVREIIEGFAEYRLHNRLLDIGFGAGTILNESSRQHWEVFGTEVSKPAFEQGSRMGFDVRHGELTSVLFPDDYFDVVTASEILEHLPDPERELKEIARILRPGGLFWATTPSARSLSFRLLKTEWSVLSPPEHTQLYSPFGARLMLAKAGFKDITLKTHGLNPTEINQKLWLKKNVGSDFDRVMTSYDLNERMTRSPFRKSIKNFMNGTLNSFGLGDSLKIYAEKGRV